PYLPSLHDALPICMRNHLITSGEEDATRETSSLITTTYRPCASQPPQTSSIVSRREYRSMALTAFEVVSARRRSSALAPVAVDVAPELITIFECDFSTRSKETALLSMTHRCGASISSSIFETGAFCFCTRSDFVTSSPHSSFRPESP